MKNLQASTIGMLLIAAVLTCCQPKSKGAFTVNVSYKNLDKMTNANGTTGAKAGKAKILLEGIPYGNGDNNPVIIDSAGLNASGGEVALKGNGIQEAIYQLVVENGPFMLLINDNSSIDVTLDLSKQENYYAVSGSEGSAMLKDFIFTYSAKAVTVNKAFEAIDSLKHMAASDSMMIVYTEKKNRAMADMNSYLQQTINNSKHPALSLFALGWASRSFQQPEFERSLSEVLQKFPDHDMLKKLKASYDMQKTQQAEQRKKIEAHSMVGQMAPELNLPDSSGKIVSLASFRGKYLLIDFWASWCGPCRQENPNVVEAYNKFRSKNFAILGVSLDKEKAPWLQAIHDDGLGWAHVSDLKFWNSKAVALYQFEGIPYNVLIDPQGKVIAESLRGFDLENKLQELLK